jgi:hypothetical protein
LIPSRPEKWRETVSTVGLNKASAKPPTTADEKPAKAPPKQAKTRRKRPQPTPQIKQCGLSSKYFRKYLKKFSVSSAVVNLRNICMSTS